MRKQVLIGITFAATIFGACAQSSKTTRTKTRAHGKTPEVTAVSLRRGACFGRCPEYTLTIKSDGTAIYEGRRNAPQMGTFQKNIGAAEAAKLMQEFSSLRVDTLQENYTANIADLPGMSFDFTIAGKKKFVGNANFGPQYLVEMGERMDQLGTVDASWKKTAEPTPAE